jgi:DNA-binding GntR family transcriptional regulator
VLLIGLPNDPRLWVKIANGIIQDINMGKIAARDRLPAQEELANQYGSKSLWPPARAIRELHELGIIYRVPGHGYYIDTGSKR